MKKSLTLALVLAIAVTACSKDSLFDDSSLVPSGSGTTTNYPDLKWSESSFTAYLDGDNTFPTLTNKYNLAVTYSSGSESVASIDASGNITLLSQGETKITASFAGSSSYDEDSAFYYLTVLEKGSTLSSAGLSWPADTYTATLGGTFSSPELTNPHGLEVSFTSSNESVATINAQGEVSLIAQGSTVISASFAGNESYLASTVSYTLTVSEASSEDDGAVNTVFPSSGGGAEADEISATTFTRLVTVTYGSSGASVSGYAAVASLMSVSVSGNQVTITYTGSENVAYKLTGTAQDGFFKLYSSKKQALWLSGLTLANPSGAAINNQSGKRTFVYVEGTNSLADGSSAAYSAPGDEDMKAVFFSEGPLVFSGSGSLAVQSSNAKGKAGITSDDNVRFMASPSVKVVSGSSAGHGVRGKDYIKVSDGTINVSVAAAMKKGFSTDSLARFDGGQTTIAVTGGSALDTDGEYSSSAGIKADKLFEMTGGSVSITNSGSGGKGLRVGSSYDASNPVYLGTSYMSGGTLTIKTTGSYYSAGDKNPKGVKIGWAVKSSGGWGGEHGSYTDMTGDFEMRGGVMTVTSSKAEAIEVKKTLTVSGGQMYAYSTGDDAINSASTFTVTGGLLCGISTANDGLDANGNFYIKGGVVYAVGKSSPELAIDANTEGGFKLYVSGGTLFTIGGLESGASLTQSCYKASSWSKNTWYSITVGSETYAFKTPSSGGSTLVVSGASQPTVKMGVTASGTSIFDGMGYSNATATGGSSVSLSSYTGGGGGPGGGGGGPGGW